MQLGLSCLQLHVAGHSLGGALATLAAFDIRQQLVSRNESDARVVCYTFAAPRTGNHAFAREYNALLPDSWSLINDQVSPQARTPNPVQEQPPSPPPGLGTPPLASLRAMSLGCNMHDWMAQSLGCVKARNSIDAGTHGVDQVLGVAHSSVFACLWSDLPA